MCRRARGRDRGEGNCCRRPPEVKYSTTQHPTSYTTLPLRQFGLTDQPSTNSKLFLVMLSQWWLRGLHSPALSGSIYKPLLRPSIQRLPMSRDVSHLTDITRAKTEEDGSFARPPTSFRNAIQHGGKYPPEKGTWYSCPSFISFAKSLGSLADC